MSAVNNATARIMTGYLITRSDGRPFGGGGGSSSDEDDGSLVGSDS